MTAPALAAAVRAFDPSQPATVSVALDQFEELAELPDEVLAPLLACRWADLATSQRAATLLEREARRRIPALEAAGALAALVAIELCHASARVRREAAAAVVRLTPEVARERIKPRPIGRRSAESVAQLVPQLAKAAGVEAAALAIEVQRWSGNALLSLRRLLPPAAFIAQVKALGLTWGGSLNLSQLELTELPCEIENLRNIKALDVRKNQLVALPGELRALALEHLNVAENRLEQVPAVVFELTTLQTLDLSFNRFGGRLSGLSQLTALRNLQLVGTKALEIPDDLSGLGALDEVYLSCQGVVPTGLGTAPNLRALKLFGHVALGELRGFSRLELLDASYTELTEVPSSIGALTSLERLYLHGNVISRLPDSIGQLRRLKRLTLSGVPPGEVARVKALVPWCSVEA